MKNKNWFNLLLEKMEKPELWNLGIYTISTTNEEISIWIGNGLFFYDFYKGPKCFSLWQKIRFHFAFKKLRALKIKEFVERIGEP